jgi:hypothetical protein
MIHFSKYLVAIGWEKNPIGLSDMNSSWTHHSTAWRPEHTSIIPTTIHFPKCLVVFGREKTIGMCDLHGESSPTFVEDGDISYLTHGPTWICAFFSRTIPFH